MRHFQKWSKFFKAACDENRQKILSLVLKEGELNATEIVKKIKLSQPTVSHHLKILCDAGVLVAKKRQKQTYYTLAQQNISNCCKGFMKLFCRDCK